MLDDERGEECEEKDKSVEVEVFWESDALEELVDLVWRDVLLLDEELFDTHDVLCPA